MKRFFVSCIGCLFFLSQALSAHYGEGWEWHSTLKVVARSGGVVQDFDFQRLHEEMCRSQVALSKRMGRDGINVALVRFSVIFREGEEIKQEQIRLTWPDSDREIAFVSGWGAEPGNMQVLPPVEDLVFFEANKVDSASSSMEPASAVLPYVCERYCVCWSQESFAFERRFGGKKLSDLNIHDPGQFFQTEHGKGPLKLSDQKEGVYRLEELSEKANSLYSSVNTIVKNMRDIQKSYGLSLTWCNANFYERAKIVVGPNGSGALSNLKQEVEKKQKVVDENAKEIKRQKGSFMMCAETLALDVLSCALCDGNSNISKKMAIAQALQKQFCGYKNRQPLHLVTHFHSAMDPCHVCSPTLWAETKLDEGVLSRLGKMLGPSVTAVTFVSSSEPYYARLYRPLSRPASEFTTPPPAPIELSNLDYVVQCRFKPRNIAILSSAEDKKNDCKSFAKKYLEGSELNNELRLKVVETDSTTDFDEVLKNGKQLKEWGLIVDQANLKKIRGNNATKVLVISPENLESANFPILFDENKQNEITKNLDERFAQYVIDEEAREVFLRLGEAARTKSAPDGAASVSIATGSTETNAN